MTILTRTLGCIDNERQQKEYFLALAVIDAVIRNEAAWIADVMTWFMSEYILDPFLRSVFESVLQLQESGGPVSAYKIAQALTKSRKPYSVTLVQIGDMISTERVAQGSHVRYYAMEVYGEHRRHAAAEELTETAEDMIRPHNDPDDVLAQLPEIQSKYAPPPSNRTSANSKVFQDIIDELDGKTTTSAFEFGIDTLDRVVGGVPHGALVTVGARSSNGKSVFLGHCALKCARVDGRVALFFSQEMAQAEMYKRWASVVSRLPRTTRKKGEFSLGVGQVKKMADDGLLEVFAGPRTAEQIMQEAMVYCSKMDVGVIVVDYLQAVIPTRDRNINREQQIAHIAASLKQLAAKTGVPVITATQLNKQGKDTPKLSSVRESEAIVNYSNIVLLLDPDDSSAATVSMDIDVAKNRDGERDVAVAIWEKPLFTIRDQDVYDMDNYDPQLSEYPDDVDSAQELWDQAAKRQQEAINDPHAMQDVINQKQQRRDQYRS